jgi:menaquinone-dependent protoporphyrinogen oxidase
MKLPRVLVLYATTDGQTARIAERIAARISASGYAVTVRDVRAIEALWEIETHEAVIVGGSVRYGRHSKALIERVRASREELGKRPNAFFSVSLSASGPGAKPDLARRFINDFVDASGWHPREVASFGGALRYRKYPWPLRWMMRFIVGREGGETDTSRDHEYTDWDAVDAFAARFAAHLAPAAAA